MNSQGAASGIVVGHLLGATRLAFEVLYPKPPCGEQDTRPLWLVTVLERFLHYSYAGTLLFLITAGVALLVSLCGKPPPESEVFTLNFCRELKL